MSTQKQNETKAKTAQTAPTAAKPAAKGSAKGSAKKAPTRRKAAPKAAKPKLPPTVSAYGSEDKGSPYSVFKTHETFSAYTLAAFKVAGMLNLTAKGTPSIGKAKPMPGLFRMLAGKTAVGHWTRTGRIEGGKLTAKGLNEVQARLTGTSRGYHTTVDLVLKFAAAMAKGGEVEHGGKRYRFTVRHGSTS